MRHYYFDIHCKDSVMYKVMAHIMQLIIMLFKLSVFCRKHNHTELPRNNKKIDNEVGISVYTLNYQIWKGRGFSKWFWIYPLVFNKSKPYFQ